MSVEYKRPPKTKGGLLLFMQYFLTVQQKDS